VSEEIYDFFAEFSTLKNDSLLGWQAGTSETLLKGTIQEPIPQILVTIGPVVSEMVFKLIFC